MDRDGFNYMRLTVRADRRNLGTVRNAVAAFAAQLEFTLSEVEEIKIAVSEAVTNAIVHAYPDGDGEVHVDAVVSDGVLQVEVRDRGVGIRDPDRARQPGFSTHPERLGMGFALMEAFMDRVEVESDPRHGTRVRLVKRPQRDADLAATTREAEG